MPLPSPGVRAALLTRFAEVETRLQRAESRIAQARVEVSSAGHKLSRVTQILRQTKRTAVSLETLLLNSRLIESTDDEEDKALVLPPSSVYKTRCSSSSSPHDFAFESHLQIMLEVLERLQRRLSLERRNLNGPPSALNDLAAAQKFLGL